MDYRKITVYSAVANLSLILLFGMFFANKAKPQEINNYKLEQAEVYCNDRKIVVNNLEGHFKQRKISGGLSSVRPALIEIWMNNENKFFITETDQNARTCILATGTNYKEIESKKGSI